MNDETFARIVAEEVKKKATPSQAEYLRLPENWAKWQRCLNILIDNLDGQLDDIDDQMDETTDRYKALGDEGLKLLTEATEQFESQRKKISRFKFHVEARLDEVTRMIALGSDAVDDRLKTVQFLRRAIERHKEMVLNYEFEPTPIDKALWAALEGKWDFDNIMAEDIL